VAEQRSETTRQDKKCPPKLKGFGKQTRAKTCPRTWWMNFVNLYLIQVNDQAAFTVSSVTLIQCFGGALNLNIHYEIKGVRTT